MQSSDMISWKAAIRAMTAKGKDKLRLSTVINELEILPGFEAAPVVHGRWIKHDGYTECSSCEYWYNAPENEGPEDRPNYCPNCGAKMY